MHALAFLVIAGLPAAGAYYASLRLWPYTRCRRCGGTGKNAGSNRVRFGHCRACGGSGRALRFGARMLNRR